METDQINRDQYLSEIYSEIDLEAAHDLLAGDEVDDPSLCDKTLCGLSQGTSRANEDGDLVEELAL